MAHIKQIILGVTGSIAAYKAAEILRRLKDKGLKVSVVMTKEAEHFITPLTFSALSGEEVCRGLFDQDDLATVMAHIQLAQKADLVLIAPATANIIAKMACGLADDLLTCIVLATKAPIVIVPAMNTRMYTNTIVQENIQKLKDRGYDFIDPEKGSLACGTFGEGHIASEEKIVKVVLQKVGE